MSPTGDDTLNIKPLPRSMPGWSHSTQPKNQASQDAAAEAARKQIEALAAAHQQNKPLQASNPLASQPAVQTTAAVLPNPVSPAAEQHKSKKSKSYDKAKPLFTALATFLFILMVFKAPVLFTQIKYLLSSHPIQTNALPANTAAAEVVPANPVITIPKINVSAPIIFPTTTADAPNYDPELENGVVHFPNTALPGQNGNTVLFGHSSNDWWQPGSYKFIFVLLDKLAPGDTFSVNYNSRRYIYEVTNTKVVEATDVSVLNPTSTPTITLITCWPAGTSLKREIIQAKQISPSPSGGTPTVQTATSTTVLPSSSPTFADQIKQFWTQLAGGVSGKPSDANQAPAAPASGTSPNNSGLPGT